MLVFVDYWPARGITTLGLIFTGKNIQSVTSHSFITKEFFIEINSNCEISSMQVI